VSHDETGHAEDDVISGSACLSQLAVVSAATEPAVAAFNEACLDGPGWCRVDKVAAFSVPACKGKKPSMKAIIAKLGESAHDLPPYAAGRIVKRRGLGDTALFGTEFSSGGPALLAAIDAHAESTSLSAWVASQERPCPACTDVRDRAVLHYAKTGVVVMVSGAHGFDF
jgi:hypothetical protein